MNQCTFLLEQVATGFLALDGKGGHGMFASLEQWQEWAFAAKPAAPKAAKAAKPSLSYQEQKELSRMEERIAKQDERVATARRALHDPALAANPAGLIDAQKAVDAEQQKADELYQRWGELEAKAQGG